MMSLRFSRPILVLICAGFCSSAYSIENPNTEPFVYHNRQQLAQVKSAIAQEDPYFVAHYHELLALADTYLAASPNPVVNKTVIPPSGDLHDYISYAPYRWPDGSKPDGLPWKAIDGVINPVSRGEDTDYTRLVSFSEAIQHLSFAYYFSGDPRYSDKCLELLDVWFVDPATRVNPNINYGQGVPGVADGRPAGILEWSRISKVITALQLFDCGGVLPADQKSEIVAWIDHYLDWLLTSQLGEEADALRQNHATWYDSQVVGLMMYLGRTDEARARVQGVKTSRIATQITPNGQQPLETGRTKSMHYSVINLWAMVNLTYMGRALDVDLWGFQTDDGRSLPQAYQFLEPYALGEQAWPFKQITQGGAAEVVRKELRPLFSKTSTLLEMELIDEAGDTPVDLLALDALRYPPKGKLSKWQ